MIALLRVGVQTSSPSVSRVVARAHDSTCAARTTFGQYLWSRPSRCSGSNESGPRFGLPTPRCHTPGETKEIIMTTEAPSAGARIVVGVDGSEPSKLALSWAVRMSATTGASIDAVMAWHFPVNFGWGYVTDAWDPIADATKCLTDSVDEVFGAERPAGLR